MAGQGRQAADGAHNIFITDGRTILTLRVPAGPPPGREQRSGQHGRAREQPVEKRVAVVAVPGPDRHRVQRLRGAGRVDGVSIVGGHRVQRANGQAAPAIPPAIPPARAPARAHINVGGRAPFPLGGLSPSLRQSRPEAHNRERWRGSAGGQGQPGLTVGARAGAGGSIN